MRFVAAYALVASLGCATTVAIVKRHDEVTLPWLVGAAAADLVAFAVIAKEAGGLSVGGSIATSVAVTAADVVAGCFIAPCTILRR